MAAPPPSRRGAAPGTLLAPCIRGIRKTVPQKSPKNQNLAIFQVQGRVRRAVPARRSPSCPRKALAVCGRVFFFGAGRQLHPNTRYSPDHSLGKRAPLAFLRFWNLAGRIPVSRQPLCVPPAFQCPRSGFHGFQCRPPSHSPVALLLLFVLLCKLVLQALRVSAPPRECFPPAFLPHPLRPSRPSRETFCLPPSAWIRLFGAPASAVRFRKKVARPRAVPV